MFEGMICIGVSNSLLAVDRADHIIKIAIGITAIAIIIDSVYNWYLILILFAPNVFLNPISFVRSDDTEVERII